LIMASLPSIHEMFSQYLPGASTDSPQKDRRKPAPPLPLSSRRSFEQPHPSSRFSLSRNVTWDSPSTASEDEESDDEARHLHHGRCRSASCHACARSSPYVYQPDATSLRRSSWDLGRRFNPDEYRQPEIYKAERRPYACSTCHKHFKTPSSLRLHINVHTGETRRFPLC